MNCDFDTCTSIIILSFSISQDYQKRKSCPGNYETLSPILKKIENLKCGKDTALSAKLFLTTDFVQNNFKPI